MWNTPTVIEPPSAEPVTLAEAKIQCRVDEDETEFDAELTHLTKAARAHVEHYCGVQFALQAMQAQCDGFAAMARLPFAPVQSVASIAYIDAVGDPQVVDPGDYALVKDGFEPMIRIKRGRSWPNVQAGSRITLDAVAGGALPDDVRHAMLLLVGHWFKNHAAVEVGGSPAILPMGVDALLTNHRR